MRQPKVINGDEWDGPKWLKWLQTININMTCITLGLSVSLMGPSLLDLQEIFDTTFQKASNVGMICDIGSIIGLFFADLLYRRLNAQIVCIVCVFMIAAANILLPLGNLISAYIFGFISGTFLAIVEVGVYVWLVGLWKGNRPILQLYALMFGIGALSSPLIAKPFLSSKGRPMTNETVPSGHTGGVESRVEIPFILIGSFGALVALSMATSFYFDRRDVRPVQEEYHKGFSVRDWILTCLISLYHFLIVFCETAFSRFVTVYAIQIHHIPKGEATVLGSLLWTGFTVIRILMIPVALKLKSAWIVLSGQILFSSTCILMLLFPNDGYVFYGGTFMFGVGLGPLYGGSLTWLTEHIALRHGYLSFILIMTCAGSVLAPPLISPQIELRPFFFMQALTANSIMMFLVTLVMFAVAKILNKSAIAENDQFREERIASASVFDNQVIQVVDERL